MKGPTKFLLALGFMGATALSGCLDGFTTQAGMVSFGNHNIEESFGLSSDECGESCNANSECVSYQLMEWPVTTHCRLFQSADLNFAQNDFGEVLCVKAVGNEAVSRLSRMARPARAAANEDGSCLRGFESRPGRLNPIEETLYVVGENNIVSSAEECGELCREDSDCMSYESYDMTNGEADGFFACRLFADRDLDIWWETDLYNICDRAESRSARSALIKAIRNKAIRKASIDEDGSCLRGFESRPGRLNPIEETLYVVGENNIVSSAEECGFLCREDPDCMSYESYDMTSGEADGYFACRLFADRDLDIWWETDLYNVCDRADGPRTVWLR